MTTPAVETSSHPTAKEAALAGMGGTLCMSTEALRGVALPSVLLLAVLVGIGYLPPASARAGGCGRKQRRGPPGAGRELLLQVCVTRT